MSKVPKLPLVVIIGPVQLPKFEGLPTRLLNKFIGPLDDMFV